MSGLAREIEYGWCHTDHKSGHDIIMAYRCDDFVYDNKYSSNTHSLLKKLNLPYPKMDNIFRGINHDMLFIDSHALVARIGPLDISELVSPAILQPVAWISDSNVRCQASGVWAPLTVALYPGIKLLEVADKDVWEVFFHSNNALEMSGKVNHDKLPENYGYVELEDGEKVNLVLDIDNSSINSFRDKGALRDMFNESSCPMKTLQGQIKAISDKFPRLEKYERAFEYHNHLRDAFANSSFNGVSDKERNEAMVGFYNLCSEYVDKGKLHRPWTARKVA